ncbi:MAG: tRNA pseudouridine(38-40) synthase TruA [Lachnospiraceae bacterium]|nr:tRNA pseudouridine(38-40) synthase TruA [Lachnospiraceae bacterium]
MNYKMIVQYDGTRYDGWQRQGNTSNTIQGKLEAVLSRMDGEPCEVIGSGRTDAGVHSYGQAANVHLKREWSASEILEYVNRYLPEDIEVTEVTPAEERFHARLHAVKKTYCYQIGIGSSKHVFQRKYCYHTEEPLQVEEMQKAAQALVGTHDFQSFCSSKRSKKSTVRTIYEARVELDEESRMVRCIFTADGFLYNMVRILTGTLMEVGQGKRKAYEMEHILEARDRQAAGMTAPAQGLILVNVEYPQKEGTRR